MTIGDDLLEVFSWMPAKALHKLSTISTQATQLLQDPYFIKKQCQYSSSKPEEALFIQRNSCMRARDDVELMVFPDDNKTRSVGIPGTSLDYMKANGRILASSNGLLLCRKVTYGSNTALFLYNPATSSLLSIEFPEEICGEYDRFKYADLNVVFVCEGNSNMFPYDYKIILCVFDLSQEWSSNTRYMTYTLVGGSNIWERKKDIYIGGRNMCFDNVVYWNNKLYIISDSTIYFKKGSLYYYPYIACCDIETGQTEFLGLPKDSYDVEQFESKNNSLRMMIYSWCIQSESCEGVCLVTLCDSIVSVWLLYGDVYDTKGRRIEERWIRLLKAKLRNNMRVVGFTISRGSLILATQTEIYKYGLIGDENDRVEIVGNHRFEHIRFNSYVNTLRPCV